MLQKTAATLHAKMTESGAIAPSVPVIKYALEIMLNTITIASLVLIIGLVSGEPLKTAGLLVVFAVIRFISGGYHLPTNVSCIAASTVVLSVLPHVVIPELWMYGLTAASLVMMAVLAPANYDKYATISPKYYPLMKVIACLIVASNFWLGSEMLALAFAVQSCFLPFKSKQLEEES
ncbi:accessory gene regulator B family protein [Paenibacillus lignilyticus]|uniref:Accessory gene regulator B family protein n=1 Tax=Paenibacillus lignilyticus TaxID=1172615 RepID=A0ABS5C8I4_9BACL|nr:accessory gene regulator B family protein [Paenibacillus lignilyticus]MBP3962275.1 accessory gene regulator B family protein [Paenibacillus lignilyticus]